MISIIIPVYNAEKFIGRAIDSVLAQTYKDFEVIIVDDGSTDNSLDICQSYKDQRIHVFFKHHEGVGIARNKGLRIARGELIFFLDADDYIRPDALKILHDGYVESGMPIIVGGAFRKTPQGNICKSTSPINTPDTKTMLNRAGIIHFVKRYIETNDIYFVSYCWGRLYHKDLVKSIRFNKEMTLGEDGDFNLRCLDMAKGVLVINEPLYCFQQHEKASASLIPIKAASKLYDFQTWRNDLLQFVGTGYREKINSLISNIIIAQLIRASESSSYREIKALIESPFVQLVLRDYKPNLGQSKIIPFLIKLEMTRLTMYFCQRRRRLWIKNYR
jgi:glycosyltransferase involved in cell wall biosynthesis